VDVDVLRTTANHHLITQGVVYPTYYRALFPDLRNELTAVAKQARDGGLGVWASDTTTTGFDVTGLDVVQDDIVILPKLFRRLVDYLHLGDDSMAGFPAFLDQAADKFFILSTGHSTTGLDAIVEVTVNNVKMTRPIEDLVFENALTVLQEARPPFIPEGVHAMTVVVDYPPGSAGSPPHRHSGPAFGYMLEGEMLFELEGEPPRVIRAGEAFWEPGGDVIHYSNANNRDDMRCRYTVTMLGAPGQPMLTLVDAEELEARKHLRVPAESNAPRSFVKE
jgi:quercetin dioxygenase-like cupin family protein